MTAICHWIKAHPRCFLVLVTLGLLLPFAGKPFNIDDPLFIWLAQHVPAHPGNPFGFDVNWYGKMTPMWMVTENPPGAGYYYALGGSLFAWNEIGLHLAGALAALAVVLGTYRLAEQLCGQPLLAAGLLLASPVFLVSANTLMCDVPLLAAWVWAVVFWVEGLEEQRTGKLVGAGVLVALALLTKYFGAALIPLLAAYGLLRKRKLGCWAASLLIPLAALGAYQWATRAAYGHALFTEAAGFADLAQGKLGFSKVAESAIALAFTGGGAAVLVFLAPWLWRGRTLSAVLGAAPLAAAGVYWKWVLPKYPALEAAARWEVGLQFLIWFCGGLLVLWLAVSEGLRRRDAGGALLLLWVAGTFVFAAICNWTVNGRTILPLMPAVGILLARRWEIMGIVMGWAQALGIGVAAVLAVAAAEADFQMAVAMRQTAMQACAEGASGGKTVWFEGHWGFQYYAEKSGAKAVDLNAFFPSTKDVLLVPLHNTYLSEPPESVVASRSAISVAGPAGLATWQAASGAGFYSSVTGPLPFAFGPVPAESVYIYEFKSNGGP